MNIRTSAIALLLAVFSIPSVAAAQQEGGPALTLELAQRAVEAAEAEARANSWNVSIVVTDADGVPVYLRRFDGASGRSYEVALRKAATVVGSGLATSEYGQRLQAGDVAEVPNGVTFAGGVPITRGGEMVGAIATSGVQAAQDEIVSQAGADAISN